MAKPAIRYEVTTPPDHAAQQHMAGKLVRLPANPSWRTDLRILAQQARGYSEPSVWAGAGVFLAVLVALVAVALVMGVVG